MLNRAILFSSLSSDPYATSSHRKVKVVVEKDPLATNPLVLPVSLQEVQALSKELHALFKQRIHVHLWREDIPPGHPVITCPPTQTILNPLTLLARFLERGRLCGRPVLDIAPIFNNSPTLFTVLTAMDAEKEESTHKLQEVLEQERDSKNVEFRRVLQSIVQDFEKFYYDPKENALISTIPMRSTTNSKTRRHLKP